MEKIYLPKIRLDKSTNTAWSVFGKVGFEFIGVYENKSSCGREGLTEVVIIGRESKKMMSAFVSDIEIFESGKVPSYPLFKPVII